MEKIFILKKNNLKLKINISENEVTTSWLHYGNIEFTNYRKFNIDKLDFAFDTVKPVCSISEIDEISKFIYKKNKGEQLSLF